MTRQWPVYSCLAVLLFTCGLQAEAQPAVSAGDTPDSEALAENLESQIQARFEATRPAVVKIESEHRLGLLSGTGFFISPTGTIMTSASLAQDSRGITVSVGLERYPAQTLLIDPKSGIALLKINADATPHLSPFRDVKLAVGTPLLAIGYPLDYPVSPAFGLVAGFDKHFNDRFLSTTHIRAAIPCQPGQAGSPVLTLDGRLAGVLVTTIANGTGCHILPVAAARKVYEDYLRFGGVMHGWVGVTVEETAEPVQGSQAKVVDLVEGTPAASSGIRNGDIVLRVGEVAITRPLDIIDASFFLTAGDPIQVEVVRGEEVESFQVYPTYHPALAVFAPIGPSPVIPTGAVTLTLELGARPEESPIR